MRGKIKPEKSIVTYATYVALWPQLVAGPIVRASRLLPQLQQKKNFRMPNLIIGGEFVITGLFLKIVLADNLAPVVDQVFETPTAYSGINNLVAVLFFAFQIYGDFCGYSLIAIGFARIMGFDLGINFKRPYFSTSFSELWRRWHISLSSWLRDYLYVSMGGNRGTRLRTLQNLMVTMVLGGLWHGASWTFIAWGALHGGYLVAQRVFGRMNWLVLLGRTPLIANLLSGTSVFICVLVAWVFFRSPTFTGALDVFHQVAVGEFGLHSLQLKFQITLGLAMICFVMIGESAIERQYWIVLRRNRWLRLMVMSILVWLTILFGQYSGAKFLYFQF
jgi:D-alanyl-lipoteichoic acid acyltransferase DltB (MBOAT superfamily)